MGAIHRSGAAAKRPGEDHMAVAFGLGVILLVGVAFHFSCHHGGQNVVEPFVIRGKGHCGASQAIWSISVTAAGARPARPLGALDPAQDQPGALENLEMAGNRGLGHRRTARPIP